MTVRLRVDWPACRAHGLCHELLPSAVRLDPWGYPILPTGLADDQLSDARAAARACPRRALHVSVDSTPPTA